MKQAKMAVKIKVVIVMFFLFLNTFSVNKEYCGVGVVCLRRDTGGNSKENIPFDQICDAGCIQNLLVDNDDDNKPSDDERIVRNPQRMLEL
jgi:hypothetical protein